ADNVYALPCKINIAGTPSGQLIVTSVPLADTANGTSIWPFGCGKEALTLCNVPRCGSMTICENPGAAARILPPIATDRNSDANSMHGNRNASARVSPLRGERGAATPC